MFYDEVSGILKRVKKASNFSGEGLNSAEQKTNENLLNDINNKLDFIMDFISKNSLKNIDNTVEYKDEKTEITEDIKKEKEFEKKDQSFIPSLENNTSIVSEKSNKIIKDNIKLNDNIPEFLLGVGE